MLDFLIAIATSKLGLFVAGIVLGVIFDEFFTTRFAWLKAKGRAEIAKLKDKL